MIAPKAFVFNSCPIAGPILSISKTSGLLLGKDLFKAMRAFVEELNALRIRISVLSPTCWIVLSPRPIELSAFLTCATDIFSGNLTLVTSPPVSSIPLMGVVKSESAFSATPAAIALFWFVFLIENTTMPTTMIVKEII